MASSCSSVLLLSLAVLAVFATLAAAENSPLLAAGLEYNFYRITCPPLRSIVRDYLRSAVKSDPHLAAGLLRLHFHDCFVRGCDASVLLDGSASGPGEQNAPPNLTLRPSAFQAIDELRGEIDDACGEHVVSCADVLALAARDSVRLSGGPSYKVPLGRRDGLRFASRNITSASLPSPRSNVTTLLNVLSKIGLDATDLVTLSGAHTIGESHCSSFTPRLYPTQDPSMDGEFASGLKVTCPASNATNTTVMDFRSPETFDNKYYLDLQNRKTLFTSDQDLLSDSRTRGIVNSYARNQSLFFERFAYSVVKMGMLGVLTGNKGEIRTNCSARNTFFEGELGSVVESEWAGAAV